MAETLEYERKQLDRAYEAAESRIARLEEQLERNVQAAHNKAAQDARSGIQQIVDSLRQAISPHAGILLKGKVGFADSRDAGDLAGETYYVAITALGVIDQPQVMSWEAENADAFRDPMSWGDGKSVDEKSIFVGGHRRLDLVQRVRTKGEGAGLPEDEALQRVLRGRSGSELTEVVATIQRSQFELMELPPDETMVIQGGPGTGKTIIGLHRVSVLLYRHADRLKADDVLVVTPTDTLARYVQNVLPGLGRGSVRVAPMSSLARHGAGTPVPESPDPKVARQAEQVKGSERMVEVIQREVDSLTRIPEGGLDYGNVHVSPDEIRQIVERAKAQGSYYSDVRGKIHDDLETQLDVGDSDDRDTVVALFDQVAPNRSPRQLIAELLSSRKRLQASGDGILTPAEQAAIKRARTNVSDVPWTLADLPLLDTADELLNGPIFRGDKYSHIVVDEAQDLSPMQLRTLRRRLVGKGALTILGDLAQATRGWANDSWSAHLEQGGIEIDEDTIRSLDTGYRVPKVQMEFASQLIPVMDITTPETKSILDIDASPRIEELRDDAEVVAHAMSELRRLLTERGDGESIGVIGLEALLDELHVELDGNGVASQWADTSKDGHVTLVTADDAKGLEFDHVIVLRPETIYRLDPVTGPRTLYVALTRARRSLHLPHVDPLPTALTGTEPAAKPSKPAPAPAEPTSPPAAGEDGSSFRWVVPDDEGSVLVEWIVHGRAQISLLPSHGGVPVVLADGFTAGQQDDLHWAMRTASGAGFALNTRSTEPRDVAESVLEALEELE